MAENETTERCERYITTKKTNAGMKNSHIKGLNKDIQHLMQTKFKRYYSVYFLRRIYKADPTESLFFISMPCISAMIINSVYVNLCILSRRLDVEYITFDYC